MKKLMTLVAVGLCTASVLGAVDTVIWTGAENNLWTNKNNWAGGKKPTGQSHAIFDPGEGKTILIDMKGMGWGTTSDWPNLYEFKSGNTYFSTFIRYTGNGTATPGVFDIAEGATVVVSNEIFTANGKACMRKTGKGSLTCVGKFGSSAAIPQVYIDEGLFYFMSKDNATLANLNRATIKSGGTFYTTGGSTTLGSGQMVVDIEKGGTFKASCGGTSYANKIDHFEGDGTVEGVGNYAIKLYMNTACARPFSGNFVIPSGKSFNLAVLQSANQFVVGGEQTLSNLSLVETGTNLVFVPSSQPYKVSLLKPTSDGVFAARDTAGGKVDLKILSRISVATDFTMDCAHVYMPTYYGFYWGGDNCGVAFQGGAYGGVKEVDVNSEPHRGLPQITATIVRVANKNSFMTMQGGELWVHAGTSDSQFPKTFDLLAGDLALLSTRQAFLPADATAANPAVINIRGGRLLIPMFDKNTCYTTGVFADTDAMKVRVCDRQAVFKAVRHMANTGEDRTIHVYRPIESGLEEGKDGGLRLEGAPVFVFRYPVLLNGPFEATDGELQLSSTADTETTPAFFGTGDFGLGNVKFRFTDAATSKTVKFATDADATFRVRGAAQITYKADASKAAHHIEVDGAYARERGGLLILSEKGSANGFTSSFKVKDALDVNAANLVKTPILTYDIEANAYRFTTYEPENGVVPLVDTSASLDDAAEKAVVLTADATVRSGEEKSVAALMVTKKKLTVAAGGKINVGLGTDPALFVCNELFWAATEPTGTGTIDFGPREGVVVVSLRNSEVGALRLPYTFAGTGGLTLASCSEKMYNAIALSGNNTYTGPTTINSVRVCPETASAFGTGDVYVGGGERAGGRVHFNKAVTLSNDFHVSGWGINNNIYSESGGAFVFSANATLSGNVSLEGETRMSVSRNVRGTLAGTVSGDRLFLYTAPDAVSGTLALTGSNAYTGGTEVVRANLAIAKAASLGTGALLLDDGNLILENSEAETLMTPISGKGTVTLQGTEPVAFRCDLSGLDAPLDLCGTSQTFTELPPFGTITNSVSTKATIALAENLGTVEWGDYALEGKISLDIGEGTVLDLGGRTLNVYRLEKGAVGKVVNGTVNEERPLAGLMLIVK